MPEAAQLAPSGPTAALPEALGPEAVIEDDRAGKYLVFRLDDEHFGVRIASLREVMEMQQITFVPLSPPCIAGVINLRGSVLPVIDMRRKFGMKPAPRTSSSCILVVRIVVAFVEVVLGITVDEVLEVLTLEPGVITRFPPPASGIAYLLGTATVNGKLKLLLDIDEVLGNLEIQHREALLQGG